MAVLADLTVSELEALTLSDLESMTLGDAGGGGSVFSPSNWSGYDEASWTNPTAALTDFTGIIDISNLSASWKAAVQSDGGDIRVTKGDDTEIPFDVIDWSYNAGSPTGLIRLKWSGTLSDTGTQNVRVYAGYTEGTAEAYAASATYGSDNAYDSSWEGYFPTGGGSDRTSNSNDGTANGGVTVGGVSGQIGNATDFDGTDDYVALPISLNTNPINVTLSAWVDVDDLASDGAILGQLGSVLLWFDTGGAADSFAWLFDTSRTGEDTAPTGTILDTWRHIWATYNDDTNDGELYVDNVLIGSFNAELGLSGTEPNMSIGSDNSTTSNRAFDGQMQEHQVHLTARSDAWRTTEYLQTSDNASFWGTWTWTATGGGSVVPKILQLMTA